MPGAGALTVTPSDAVVTKAWGEQGAAGNPQELNRYSYVNNTPVGAGDPTGHWVLGIGITLSAALPGLPLGGGTVWSLSLGVIIDDKLNTAGYETHTSLPIHTGDLPGPGIALPITKTAASLTGNVMVNPEAVTIDDVAGKGASMGGTVARAGRAVSVDFTPSLKADNSLGPKGVTVGFGAGEGIEIHTAHTYTNLRGKNLPQRFYCALERRYSDVANDFDRGVRHFAGVPE